MGEREPKNTPREMFISNGYYGYAQAAYDNAYQALGYSTYCFVAGINVDWSTRMLAVDGVTPSEESLIDGSYPLCTAYYAIYPKSLPENHPARRLVTWLLSDEGQQVAKNAGYVPVRFFPPIEIATSSQPPTEAKRSSGTGGTVSRWGEPFDYLRSPESFDDWSVDLDELLAAIPKNRALEKAINEWEKKIRMELNLKASDESVYGRLRTNPSLLYLWLSPSKDWQGETEAVFDPVKGEKLELSDMFYDGFDYLGYIDSIYAANSLGVEGFYRGEYKEPDRFFTSVARDFYFQGGSDHDLTVDLDSEYSHSKDNPFIPLWHGISPYGACKVHLDYYFKEAEESVYLPKVTIDEGMHPDAEAAINMELSRIGEMEGEYYYAFIKQEGRYWSIWYPTDLDVYCQQLFPWANYGQIFDLHTGQPLITPDLALTLAMSPQATVGCMDDFDFGHFTDFDSTYTPPVGTQVHAIYLKDGEEGLLTIIQLVEPNGRQMYIFVPFDVLSLPVQRYTADDIFDGYETAVLPDASKPQAASPYSEKVTLITNQTVNIRSGPGKEYQQIGEVYPGASFYYTGIMEGNYYQILYPAVSNTAELEDHGGYDIDGFFRTGYVMTSLASVSPVNGQDVILSSMIGNLAIKQDVPIYLDANLRMVSKGTVADYASVPFTGISATGAYAILFSRVNEKGETVLWIGYISAGDVEERSVFAMD